MEAAALFVAAYTSLLRMVLPRQVYAQVEASSAVLEVLKITPGSGRSMATPRAFGARG